MYEAQNLSWLTEALFVHFPKGDKYLKHSIGTYKHMENLLNVLDIKEQAFRTLCLEASLVHDIGHAPRVARIDFHPVDGYLYLLTHNVDTRVCSLVLNHTFSKEIAFRNRPELLSYYGRLIMDDDQQKALDFLTYCDLHTSWEGRLVTLEERIEELYEVYSSSNRGIWITIESLRPSMKSLASKVEAMISENL